MKQTIVGGMIGVTAKVQHARSCLFKCVQQSITTTIDQLFRVERDVRALLDESASEYSMTPKSASPVPSRLVRLVGFWKNSMEATITATRLTQFATECVTGVTRLRIE